MMKVSFVGHSTIIVQTDTVKFITDPLLVKRIARIGPKRRTRFRLARNALRELDFVLISHGHFDHLDLRSLRRIPKDVPVFCHPSLARLVRKTWHRDLRMLEPWESAELGGVTVTAVPAHHFSSRPPFHFKKDFQGYVVEAEKTLYFAGDTGTDPFFKDIGQRFDIDVCFLPIGAYHPRSFRRKHLSPEDALDAVEMLGAKLMIPMHWGTFNLSWEPFREPPRRLMYFARKRALTSWVKVLKPGEKARITAGRVVRFRAEARLGAAQLPQRCFT